MKLGVSELAWSNLDKLDTLFKKFKENKITHIETVLPKHLEWNNCKSINLTKLINNYEEHNIITKSTQSIFYNSNVDSFNDIKFLQHIDKVSSICKIVGISKLVLGAPSLRKKVNLNKLYPIFLEVDTILEKNDQILLIEPNSRIYSGNFFFTLPEIIRFIKKGKFKNIKTMIDTHNVILENEIPSDIFLKYREYVQHVHVSENELGPFKFNLKHVELAESLNKVNYNGLVIYESKPFDTLYDDIEMFSKVYGG